MAGARQVTVPVGCTLNHIGCWVREQVAANANDIRGAIFTTAGVLIAQTAVLEDNIGSTATFALKQLNFAGQAVSAGNYIIAVVASGTNGNVVLQGQNDSAGAPTYLFFDPEITFPTFPSDVSTSIRTDATRQWDLYLDYTEAASVTVSSVTPSTTLRVNQVGAGVTGSGFGATQGSGFVRICPSDDIDDVNGVNQTVTSWGDTAIAFSVAHGTLALATNLYLFVQSDGGASNASGSVVQIRPSFGALAIGAGLLLT